MSKTKKRTKKAAPGMSGKSFDLARTRLKFFLAPYPAEWRFKLATEIIQGILFGEIRFDTDFDKA